MYSTLCFILGLLLNSLLPDGIFHTAWEKSLCSKYVLSISGVAWIQLSRGNSQEEAGAHPAPDLYLMNTKMVKSELCVGWLIYLLFTMPHSLPFFSYFFSWWFCPFFILYMVGGSARVSFGNATALNLCCWTLFFNTLQHSVHHLWSICRYQENLLHYTGADSELSERRRMGNV